MSDKKKSAPLQAKQAIVKSTPKLPATKAKREYFEFDVYIEAARILSLRLDKMRGSKAEAEFARGDLEFWYREFARGREAFERDELYRKRKTRRQNLVHVETDHEIIRRVVVEKIGLLIGSFPNAAPGNAETYVGMLIEEIIAANPSVTALEATCRKLRRTKTWIPTISEVLAELKEQADWLEEMLCVWEDDIAYWLEKTPRKENP